MLISAPTLRGWLSDGQELAVLDAREEGAYSNEHLFHAVNLPLSQLELRLEALVPRPTTRLVWCDDGQSHLAQTAAEATTKLGWTEVAVLDGGNRGWSADGGELYSGVNVPSKAFGGMVEHAHKTPRITATDLQQLFDQDENVIVLDSRPFHEYRRMSIPNALDCPGAELVHRVGGIVTDPDTLVVVNCAGRTRSILGAQSLINAGLENQVVALENGTMGWQLAGFEVVTGAEVEAPEPDDDARRWAHEAASAVGRRYRVGRVDSGELESWLADETRTTYLLDVRTAEEFEAGHLAASRHAPGGQLIQATDVYVATRNARLVLIDDTEVRATMTASWLRQMGWPETVVLAGGLDAAIQADGLAVAKGKEPRPNLARVGAPVIRPPKLAERLAADPDGVSVIDVGTSSKYRNRGHIPGSWWAVRARLDEARAAIGDASTVVLTSTDGTLAKLAVADAAKHWPEAEVLALAAGNRGWRHAGYEMEPGFSRPTTEADDVWRSLYDGDHLATAARRYLDWEVALLDQIERDPTVQLSVATPEA